MLHTCIEVTRGSRLMKLARHDYLLSLRHGTTSAFPLTPDVSRFSVRGKALLQSSCRLHLTVLGKTESVLPFSLWQGRSEWSWMKTPPATCRTWWNISILTSFLALFSTLVVHLLSYGHAPVFVLPHEFLRCCKSVLKRVWDWITT